MTIKYADVSIKKTHKDLAAYYESVGDLKRASKEYLSLAYIYPMDAANYYYAADFAHKADDYGNAVRILRESPNSDTSSYVQFTLASIYFSQKKFKEALLSIEIHQKNHLDNKNYLLGEKLKYKIERDSGLTSEAEKTLASIKKLDPNFDENSDGKSLVVLIPAKVKPYIIKAEKLRKSGHLSEALAALTEANKIRETAYANLLIGKILISQKNITALDYMEKAYKEYKDDPSLTYNLSLLYLMKGDFLKAEVVMNDFARVKGKDNPQFKQLENLYEKQLRKRKM